MVGVPPVGNHCSRRPTWENHVCQCLPCDHLMSRYTRDPASLLLHEMKAIISVWSEALYFHKFFVNSSLSPMTHFIQHSRHKVLVTCAFKRQIKNVRTMITYYHSNALERQFCFFSLCIEAGTLHSLSLTWRGYITGSIISEILSLIFFNSLTRKKRKMNHTPLLHEPLQIWGISRAASLGASNI